MKPPEQKVTKQAAVIFALALAGCGVRQVPTAPAAAPAVAPRTSGAQITSLKTRQVYTITHVPDTDAAFERLEQPEAAPAGTDNFTGTDRKAAKISLSKAKPQTFATLGPLLDSGLFIPDATMLSRNPPIPKGAASNRVNEEQHNVTVTALLYASAKESDNDFHCIIGTPMGQAVRFLNVEVSGLPASGAALAPLKSVRDTFKAFFGANLPDPLLGYSIFNPPIPIQITGSIFFDIDHPAGTIGPPGMHPTTAWEVHPLSKLVFEP